MEKKLPLSVCMISGAEAHRIGRALASVGPWVAEIIVVLNEEVRDGTEELARDHGAHVFREAWKGHIAQKNSAAAKARQPWILGLDADEAVSDGLRGAIEGVFAGGAERYAAYAFPRCSQYFGRWIRHGDWYPDWSLRLWQRGRGRWGGIDPHDKLEVEGRVGRLRGDLLHYPTETIEFQVQKTVAYANDFARHCEREQRRVTMAELVVRPPWRFLRSYVFKLGFLDGWQGYTIAWMTAFYTFLRYARAREAQLQAPGRSPTHTKGK